MNTNYPIEAFAFLLQEDCLSDRFHSLIRFREKLISELEKLGCISQKDVLRLSDDELAGILSQDKEAVKMFRRFLILYDPKPQKFKEIAKLTSEPMEQAAFRELYHLPGVRFIRADLYYRSGYKSLQDFCRTTVEEVLARTSKTIYEQNLSCVAPLPKEIRTHIAVARAFSM